jgi:hypothetical protein
MLIAFHDFIPQTQRKRLGIRTDIERLQEVVSRANRWIEQHQIDVLNVETILMSNLPDEASESPQTRMDAPGTMSFSVYQIVRVWFRQGSGSSAITGQTTRLVPED